MRIVFGWNHIKLKTFTLEELNLDASEENKDITFVVSQSYFHLFWIPFFPLGKRYSFKKGRDYFKVSPQIMAQIDKQQIHAKGKWYAWMWMWLLAAAVVVTSIFGMVSRYQREQDELAYKKQTNELIMHPKVGDQLSFYLGEHRVYAEIQEVKKDAILLLVDFDEYYKNETEKELNYEYGSAEYERFHDSVREVTNYRSTIDGNTAMFDSLMNVYPKRELLCKMLMLEQGGVPKYFDTFEVPRKEYERFKYKLSEGAFTEAKVVRLPALRSIGTDKCWDFGTIKRAD